MRPAFLLCIWLSIFSYSVVVTKKCPEESFDCGNGLCLWPQWLCDGANDCDNWKDEIGCDNDTRPIINCETHEFSCDNGTRCIPQIWVCDRWKDCFDGWDEADCENSTYCKNGFICGNGKCLPSRWRCDGIDDCGDNSDEVNCSSSKECSISEGYFSCTNNDCLPLGKLCDGKKDCPNGEDEIQNCSTSPSSVCSSINCTYKCIVESNLPHCYCPHGYELSKEDNQSCIDINECNIAGYCSHICLDTEGGAKCSCMKGYELQNNTCVIKDDDPLLIFSTERGIRGKWLRSGNYFSVGFNARSNFGISCDTFMRRIYWVNESSVNSIVSAWLDYPDVTFVLPIGLNSPIDIAIDWVGRNLYITDSGLRSIVVCQLDRDYCIILNSNIKGLRFLALDPPMGTMFWTKWGNGGGIYKQGMDGSNTIPFVTGLSRPNGIAADVILSVLYWVDSETNSIESINMDGTNRKLLLKDSVFSPFALDVFEDTLYWSDLQSLSITTCNKFTGRNISHILRSPYPIRAIHVYHPYHNRQYNHNPCWYGGCSHMCLIAPRYRYSCVCPLGLTLSSDNKVCVVNKMTPRLYIWHEHGVYVAYPESIGKIRAFSLPIMKHGHIRDVTYDWENQILFTVDKNKAIIAINMSSNTLDTRFLLYKHILTGTIEKLSYDYIGENLYWIDGYFSRIEVASINGLSTTILVDVRATDLALNPEKGVMYVAVITTPVNQIAMYDMDGKNRRTIVATESNSISFSSFTNDLYWVSIKENKIMKTNLNSLNTSLVAGQLSERVKNIAVSKHHIFWTSLKDQEIYYDVLSNPGIPRKISLTEGPTGNVNLGYIHPKDGKKVCRNSGCSKLCLVTPTGYTCACPIGYVLAADNRSCIEKQCEQTEFKCGTGECISKHNRCDYSGDCLDRSDEDNCEYTCPPTDFKCSNGRCIAAELTCDGEDDCHDNSDEADCSLNTTISPNCLSEQFSCHNGDCLPIPWVCDMMEQCTDGEDEKDCETNKCPRNYKRCNSGQCVRKNWWCDGVVDCQDYSDEDENNCKAPKNCTKKFRCRHGECIDYGMVCDGNIDCPGGDDEDSCAFTNCTENTMRCNDGRCIPNHYVCDYFNDCKEGEDEKNCSIACGSDKFMCHDGMCIAKDLRCDGRPHCKDASDEFRCSIIISTVAPACSEIEFRCHSGQCIPKQKVCDGKFDCLDNSDESKHCSETCSINNGGCSQICKVTLAGLRCSCFPGYELKDKVSCVDINECAITGSCSHYCYNTKHGYNCACEMGYELKHDQKTCKAVGPAPIIVFSVRGTEIRSAGLHSSDEHLLVKEDEMYVKGLDFDTSTKSIIWSKYLAGQVRSFSMTSGVVTTVISGLRRCSAVAYDWLGLNYYVSSSDGIHACSNISKQMHCYTLFKMINEIAISIALVPKEGLMFWGSVLPQHSRIECSEMDGSSRRVLVNNLFMPESLAVDYVLRTLYWTEPTMSSIESIDFEGNNRKAIACHDLGYPFSLSVFEDNLYWSDWDTHSILSCNKFTGEKKNATINNALKSYIKIIHPVLQPSSYKQCLRKNCSHLCLLSSKGAKCRCPDNYTLTPSGCINNLANSCTPDHCQHGGKCVNGDPILCICAAGYNGEKCENKVNTSQSKHNSVILAVVLTIILSVIILVAFLYYRKRSKTTDGGKGIIMSFREMLKIREDKENLVLNMEEKDGPSESQRQKSCEDEIYSEFPQVSYLKYGDDNGL